jgi:hypothetical protein
MPKKFRPNWRRLRIAPPRDWPDWIIRKVGYGPLVWLPPEWKKPRASWKASVVWIVDAPCLVPWAALALSLYRAPERLMTEEEVQTLNFAKMAISVHENDPKYIRLVDRWRRARGLAQKAADERVRARAEQEDS